MSLPHVISAHASLQTTRDEPQQERSASHFQNQDIIEKQQALTTSSTFVSLSEEGKKLARETPKDNKPKDDQDGISQQNNLQRDSINHKHTQEEKQEIDHLRRRDQEVKIHERAHAMIGGQYASAPSFTYETGPDGRRYVSDGEVSIDLTTIPNDPAATIDKMEQVYRAALAPAEPSNQDRVVAAEARQTITSAKIEQKKEGLDTDDKTNVSVTNTSLTNNVTPENIKSQNYINAYLHTAKSS